MSLDDFSDRRINFPPPRDGDVVEMSLLIPGWQAAVLETVAHGRGLTAGQFLRWLIRDFCAQSRQATCVQELEPLDFPTDH